MRKKTIQRGISVSYQIAFLPSCIVSILLFNLRIIIAEKGEKIKKFFWIDNTIRVQCFFEETAPLSALFPSAHNTSVFLGRAPRR